VAKTVLHELRHVSDGQQFCGRYYREAERSADDFAALVMTEAWGDFHRLDHRGPSERR
jgi:hypothetical protein